MLRTIRTFFLFSAALDLIAFGIFWFTDQQGLYGYASVLIYCSVATGLLGAFSVSGSGGARHPHDEYLHTTSSSNETRRIDRQSREQGLSFGLILFGVALLSGISGYVLSRLTHP